MLKAVPFHTRPGTLSTVWVQLIDVLCTFSFETHSTKSGVACPHLYVGCALILPCVPTDVRQRCNDAVSGKPMFHCHRLSATDGDGVPECGLLLLVRGERASTRTRKRVALVRACHRKKNKKQRQNKHFLERRRG